MRSYRTLIQLVMIMLCVETISAQHEGDSLKINFDALKYNLELPSIERSVETDPRLQLDYKVSKDYRKMKLPDFDFSLPTPGPLFDWKGGGAYAAMNTMWLPGMMTSRSAGLHLIETTGKFTFTAFGDLRNYSSFSGSEYSFGYGGSVSYQASEKVGLTVYGAYHSPVRRFTPGMTGFISMPSIGGFVDFDIGQKWGLRLGASSQRSIMDRRWHTQPIFMPYYKLNDIKIGIDFGGLLYQFIQWNKGKTVFKNGNPTVEPPKLGPLPVGPRPIH